MWHGRRSRARLKLVAVPFAANLRHCFFLDEVGGPQYLTHIRQFADDERLLENALLIYACWKKREEASVAE